MRDIIFYDNKNRGCYKMIEINWNIFRAKFNGKEQIMFENLCYLLFCVEFKQDSGVFRYKNQTGVETEPIEHEGKVVGFQAKFYETKISDNVNNLKDSIDKAKNKNPNLNKILFYINQEFSESSIKSQKEPQYKINIEEYAQAKGLEIEWRVPSHLERQLSLQNNFPLAKYYFSLEKSAIDLIQDLVQHTESILTPIRSNMEFMGNIIKLDRSTILADLKITLAKSSVVILSGQGGVGKTAVIKDFYTNVKDTTPIIVFKATEFNISNINDIFNAYGNFKLTELMEVYQLKEEKYIVIDSAEKLSDIENPSIFQEFLSILINNEWKIIFTTRHSYLDDLKFELIEIYKLPFLLLNIGEIKKDELEKLSSKYCFNLPQNEKLLELLQSPFYLAEYLSEYGNIENSASLSDFINLLWNKQILKLPHRRNNIHIRRENCFLQIAHKRANEGQFFVNIKGDDNEALQSLEIDEIIKYDVKSGGYFITHDIYEEWALDKMIERAYISLEDYDSFFSSLGSSLPIRRAFRNWLSEKLFTNQADITLLIKQSLVNDAIESFWKDEMIISILLTKYAGDFFQLFKARLLENEQELLLRVVFLLRIACKRVDDDFLTQIGLNKTSNSILTMLYTIPKGIGWSYTIDFIHENKEILGTRHISTILPMLADWNNKNTQGNTTKKASQIGLFYYENIVNKDRFGYGSNEEIANKLIKIILQGASEIKEELKYIFECIITRNNPTHHDRDYALVKVILTSITDNIEIIKSLPDYVIELAKLYWIRRPKENDMYTYDPPGVEKYFGISDRYDFNYSPASAFQTPIYQLLRFSPNITIDFILLFNNMVVENYINSELNYEVEEVKVIIDDKIKINQYVSDRLWNTYRGTRVSTNLLESMHMALEKWLLEYANIGTVEHLENLCYYLIKNSDSASITSVVASVVMAYPSKLFNIAKILFRTKQFFNYDTTRLVLDESAKFTYSIGYGLNLMQDIHHNERIKTCDDKHRKRRLEDLAVEYQFFRSDDISVEEADKRQKYLWKLFDKYYEELNENKEETEFDSTWKLYLARMDRRKMKPEVEQADEGIIINFNPQIEPNLKKYSEESLQKINNANKYMPLYLWARDRFDKNKDKYCQYQQYETNHKLVLKEVREIIQGIEDGALEELRIFNHSIPSYACSVLIRDFDSILSLDEIEFCKDIVLNYSTLPFQRDHYIYQISAGIEPAISVIPHLYKYYSENDVEEAEGIKALLIVLLLCNNRETFIFAARAILESLWEFSFEDSHSIFLGYLNLKHKYNSLIEENRKEKYSKGIYEIANNEIVELFLERYEIELERIVSNKINYDDIPNLQNIELGILTDAFELLPLGTNHPDHTKFALEIFPIIARRVFERNRYNDEDKFDYSLKTRFLDKFAAFVLSSDKEKIETYIKPFIANFKVGDDTSRFFECFISAEDYMNKYEEFWNVWKSFYNKVKAICSTESYYHYTKKIIYNYLLAGPYWKKTAKEWHSLKEREKLFFKKVSEDMGHFPPVLYSISKVLNDIGSSFLEDGILWISNIIENNKNLLNEELEINTIYYIENIVRKYIFTSRQKIRTNLKLKKSVICILNFLIERGSATGYLLRENIL